MDARGQGKMREGAAVGAGVNALHSGADMRTFCSAPCAIGSARRHKHAPAYARIK